MDRGPLTSFSCIHRLRIDHAIPASLVDRPAIEARVVAASGQPLREALAGVFAEIEAGDPQAVWVIRTLEVQSVVPLAVTDPDVIAARLADAVHQAVRRAVAAGPSTCVRFESRAAFVAAFVRAVVDGASSSWLFRRLAPARGLRPAAALVVASRLVGTDLVDVVAACAEEGSWEPMVSRLTTDEASQLIASLHAARPPVAASTKQRRRLDQLSAEVVLAAGPVPRPVVRLIALGRALRADGDAPGLVLAALDPVDRHRALPRHERVHPAGGDAAVAPADARPPVEEMRRFWSPGVAAFVLATSIPSVAGELGLTWLAADTEAGSVARVQMLRRLLGVSWLDPAILLAAGWRSAPPVEGDEVPELDADRRSAVASALARTGRDGAQPSELDRSWLADGSDVEPMVGVASAPMVGLASVLGRHFVSRLVGFQATPFEYLVPRLFGSWGVVAVDDSAITVEIEAPPLLVVLQLAGLADFVTNLPWRTELIVVRHEVRG